MIDLTLDSLTVPGIPDYEPPFGTVKDPLVSLSTVETNNNIIKPFTAQRAVEFSHDEEVSRIERNACLVFTGDENAVLDLSDVTTFKGNELKVVNTTSHALTIKYMEVGESSFSTVNLVENIVTFTADSNSTYSIKVSVESESITTLWSGTKEQFDAIPVKDSNTLYNIIDDVDEELIQDDKISPNSTWSSERIVGELYSKEYLALSWTEPGIGFNPDLEDIASGGLRSIKEKFLISADERWFLDLGEHWDSISAVYAFNRTWQSFFINRTPESRVIEFPQMGGEIRIGVNSGFAFTPEITLYKMKRADYIPVNSLPPFDYKDANIFTFGDSIAYGHVSGNPSSVAKQKITQIVAQILQCSTDTKNNTNNKAISGSTWASVEGRTRMLSTLQDNLPSIRTDSGMILLMAGINDYWNGVSIPEFRQAVVETLNWIQQNSRCKITVVSPIEFQPSVTIPSATVRSNNPTLDAYREVLKEETARKGCFYVDGKSMGFNCTPGTGFAQENLFSDGLHPNDAGYVFYGLRLAEALTGVALKDDVVEGYSWTGQMVLGHPVYRYATTNKNATSINLVFSNIRVVNMFGSAQDGTNVVPLNFGRPDETLAYRVIVNHSLGSVTFEKSTYTTKRLLVIDFYLED